MGPVDWYKRRRRERRAVQPRAASQPSLPRPGRAVERGVRVFSIALALAMAVVGIVFTAGAANSAESYFAVLGSVLALEFAALALGGLSGLLFGMPREIDRTDDARPAVRFLANTGLLRISEWLTTVIVGLSLVSLGRIPGALVDFGDWITPALGGSSSAAFFAIAFGLCGVAGSFMLMFLWTTVTLRSHLEDQAREITMKLNYDAALVDDNALDVEDFKRRLGDAPDESIDELRVSGWAKTASAGGQAIVEEWLRRRGRNPETPSEQPAQPGTSADQVQPREAPPDVHGASAAESAPRSQE